MTSFMSIDESNKVRLRDSTSASMVNSTIEAVPTKPTRIRPYMLSKVNDLKIQSGLIIKDLLFALLGYEGCYIRYSEKYDSTNIPNQLLGPDFKIAKNLDISLKGIAKKLVWYGKYYGGLTAFYQLYNQPKYGKVIQRFCCYVHSLLDQYQNVVVEIENEFKFNANFNMNFLKTILDRDISNKLKHIYEISLRMHQVTVERSQAAEQPDLRFQDILANVKSSVNQAGILESLANNGKFTVCKGGLALRVVQDRINLFKGDSDSSGFLTQLFELICEDYVEMLNKWLITGDIDDPYDEFVIREKPVPDSLIDIFHARSEHYWNELFIVKTDGLIDHFSNVDVQLKILNTGKFLNVFKLCTGLNNFNNLNEIIEPITGIYTHDLELKIEAFYNRANKLLMKLLFEGMQFRGLINEFQSVFLFKDSFKIDNFLDKSFLDLKRNRYNVSVSRLEKNYLDTFEIKGNNFFDIPQQKEATSISAIVKQNQKFSITSSNFYQVAKEIMEVEAFDNEDDDGANLRSLLNKTFKRNASPTEGEKTGHDPNHSDEYAITSIDLSVGLPFPLNLIVIRELSYHYELMFKILIILKFISKFNDNTWRDINHSEVWKHSSFDPRIKKWILRCRILHSRVREFVNELQIYFNYDVVESRFKVFEDSLARTEEILKEKVLGSDVSNNNNNLESHFNSKFNTFNNYNSNNTIFDDKIHNSRMNKARTSSRSRERELANVETLISNLSEFLNTLINDSLITKPHLLLSLKKMVDIVISFNHYLSRLKKVLITCDVELFDKYSTSYPEMFKDKTMDATSINNRYVNMDNSLHGHFDTFSATLSDFIAVLKTYGESENKSILTLSETLERCFPE